VSDYILGSDAVLDLEDIWDYIAADSIDAADRWIAKTLRSVRRDRADAWHLPSARRSHAVRFCFALSALI
jgi:plasmid stabilization system protein ParE